MPAAAALILIGAPVSAALECGPRIFLDSHPEAIFDYFEPDDVLARGIAGPRSETRIRFRITRWLHGDDPTDGLVLVSFPDEMWGCHPLDECLHPRSASGSGLVVTGREYVFLVDRADRTTVHIGACNPVAAVDSSFGRTIITSWHWYTSLPPTDALPRVPGPGQTQPWPIGVIALVAVGTGLRLRRRLVGSG